MGIAPMEQVNDLVSGLAPTARASVLLVEDEPAISEPFSNALSREGFSVQVTRTGAETLASFAERQPDIVLLDLALPDCDGRDLARQLRGRSSVPIIIVTARGSETDRVVGLELGADDYVVKPFSSAEVVARIRAVLRRSIRRAVSQRTVVGDVAVDASARRAWRAGQELVLTRKEFDLLARLVETPGQVVTREQLMCDVWDENWFGSTKTLDVHMASLRRKLGEAAGTATRIQTVRGVGFRFTRAAEG